MTFVRISRRPVSAGLVSVAALASLLTAGCGLGNSNESETPLITTVTESVVSPAEPAQDAEPLDAEGEIPTGPSTVPDVVGMDHQLAQDTMQEAGFYLLDEVDGSGAGRMLLLDRNWTTVAQDPPAGSTATPDTMITLTAIKDGD